MLQIVVGYLRADRCHPKCNAGETVQFVSDTNTIGFEVNKCEKRRHDHGTSEKSYSIESAVLLILEASLRSSEREFGQPN